MTEVKNKGLSLAKGIYQDRSKRIKELRAEGKKVMGYLCLYPVVEMMTALDLIPYRIFGEMGEQITEADAYLPSVVCPFLRSCLDLGLKGKYDFLDGVVMAHVCDVGEKTAHIWRIYLNPDYYHFIDTPHTVHEAAQKHLKELLGDFQTTLESFAGKSLTTEKLEEAIRLHNTQRALVRELYELRKPDPPLISGSEVLETIVALMSIPVEEGNVLLRQVIDEVKGRESTLPKKPRLLVWGSILDDTSIINMIEGAGANVVMDDICVGSRAYFSDVKLTKDPLEGLAYHYLVDLKCPRTFREGTFGEMKKNYLDDLESRFGYVRHFAEDWKAQGAIVQAMRYCDTHAYEVPLVKDYFDHLGLPNTYIEIGYTEASLAPLRTRVQALLELIN